MKRSGLSRARAQICISSASSRPRQTWFGRLRHPPTPPLPRNGRTSGRLHVTFACVMTYTAAIQLKYTVATRKYGSVNSKALLDASTRCSLRCGHVSINHGLRRRQATRYLYRRDGYVQNVVVSWYLRWLCAYDTLRYSTVGAFCLGRLVLSAVMTIIFLDGSIDRLSNL